MRMPLTPEDLKHLIGQQVRIDVTDAWDEHPIADGDGKVVGMRHSPAALEGVLVSVSDTAIVIRRERGDLVSDLVKRIDNVDSVDRLAPAMH